MTVRVAVKQFSDQRSTVPVAARHLITKRAKRNQDKRAIWASLSLRVTRQGEDTHRNMTYALTEITHRTGFPEMALPRNQLDHTG